MGLVTICKGRRTRTPLFLEQAGINVYSLEELSYFLYHNICLVERRMFDERLLRWIGEEAGFSELASRLRNGQAGGTSIQNLVLSVVGASELYSPGELSALEERIKGLSRLQEQERLKLRADELLENHNEWAAMEEYRHILKMHQNSRLGMAFYAAVWNNLGVCHARQFQFAKAAECFETSCEYLPDEETEKQALLARQLAEGKKPAAPRKNDDAGDPQKKLLQWEREYRQKA